jgi:hypothetical protein
MLTPCCARTTARILPLTDDKDVGIPVGPSAEAPRFVKHPLTSHRLWWRLVRQLICTAFEVGPLTALAANCVSCHVWRYYGCGLAWRLNHPIIDTRKLGIAMKYEQAYRRTRLRVCWCALTAEQPSPSSSPISVFETHAATLNCMFV